MEFEDEYQHSSPNLLYFPQNVPSERVIEKFYSQLPGCNCTNSCNPENCICIKKSGTSYNFTNQNELKSYRLLEIDKNKPTFECNENCTCNKTLCGHKLVQFGPRQQLYTKEAPGKGLGLFSNETIPTDCFICEYAGEFVLEEEAMKRFARYTKLNYIFCLKEHFGNDSQKFFIDPTNYGNIGRYINHSCTPNTALHIIRYESSLPTLCIFSAKQIDANTEITMDYGQIPCDSTNKLTKCLCNSENCPGFLPFDSELLLTEDR